MSRSPRWKNSTETSSTETSTYIVLKPPTSPHIIIITTITTKNRGSDKVLEHFFPIEVYLEGFLLNFLRLVIVAEKCMLILDPGPGILAQNAASLSNQAVGIVVL